MDEERTTVAWGWSRAPCGSKQRVHTRAALPTACAIESRARSTGAAGAHTTGTGPAQGGRKSNISRRGTERLCRGLARWFPSRCVAVQGSAREAGSRRECAGARTRSRPGYRGRGEPVIAGALNSCTFHRALDARVICETVHTSIPGTWAVCVAGGSRQLKCWEPSMSASAVATPSFRGVHVSGPSRRELQGWIQRVW
jgi:hypothetical protein